jgi:hypothetical protein
MGENEKTTMPREGTRHQETTKELLGENIFRGFNPPTSNTTYTPNQLFDVALVHASRGCFRLVAYMLRKTLGWCDADGNPQEPEVLVSYNDLVQKARVARGIIRPSIDEALAAHYIECVREGRPSLAGAPAITPLFRLKWDHTGAYSTKPSEFRGFYAREGYRTYVPNQFFDHVVPNEQLGVIKVVGAVIRNTIGWQNEYGFRRQRVQLSYTSIQRIANFSRRALRLALSEALEHNYIVRLKEGVFSPDTEQQQATTYGLKWLDHAEMEFAHEVAEALQSDTGSKSTPGDDFEDRFKKYPSTSSINTPGNRFKKYPTIKIKQQNKTSEIKQQQTATGGLVAVVDDHPDTFQILLDQGFSHNVAARLASAYPYQRVSDQLNWLRKRNPSRNPLGMLRRAIEENWPKPPDEVVADPSEQGSLAATFAAHFYAGRAGNQETPVAPPSANDLQEAETFVQRLLEVWPEEDQVAEWGREFGTYVRQAERHNERAIISFVAALRSHGDEFFRQHRDRKEEADRRTHAHVQEEQFEQRYPAYLAFLKERETEFAQRHPERYQTWQQQFERTSFAAQQTEEGRLKAFRQAAKLPRFSEWDQEHSESPLTIEKVNA